ncbi:MAG: M13 family metallopeptidase [Elusimicrobia bacterium]|nr:M13 family metallopeptidase [Elusimicrobiota bacterium]
MAQPSNAAVVKADIQAPVSRGLEFEWQKQSVLFDRGGAVQAAAVSPVLAAPSVFKSGLSAPPKDVPRALELGVDVSAMDASVRPQDDFFRFVNGTWLRTHEIPADKSRDGAFFKLMDKTKADVRRIIEESGRGRPAAGSDAQKIADLYKSFMDVERIESLGLAPVAADLAAIRGIANKEGLAVLFARAYAQGVDVPVGLSVDVDAKSVSENITAISQSGLGLPGREYYLKEDAETAKVREKYLEYAAKLLALAGEADAARKAETVYRLEKALARHQWAKEEARDPEKLYNKMALGELEALAGGFAWKAYFRAARIPETEPIVVGMPSYFAGFAQLVQELPLEDWRLYMTVRVLSGAAALLPAAFVEAKFEYEGRALSGQPENMPRWERGVNLVNGAIGEIVGRVYVERHFPESSKKRMLELVENLREAYGDRIRQADWLTEATRREALEKLRKFTPKIGYPDKWRDYSALTVDSGDLAGNMKRVAALEYDHMIGKLGKPVDRTEWHMPPTTVNAYYAPDRNEIVFPAAILQPPFFNPAADDAVNYGAIGAVIGHEMGHGFDDKGSQFDGSGALRDWWTPEDRAAFTSRTERLVRQYDSYEPLPGLHLNGRFTLGENIGDFGGLTVAQRAYELSLRGSPAPIIAGFTGPQRFFLGWGQVWRGKMREKELRRRIETDTHSPFEYRVNGVVRNMPSFYRAFGVREGDKLHLPEDERVQLW